LPRQLRPSAPVAADALLPGDPGRALALAQELLEAPKMSNHSRGLWGYWGKTAAGRELTIQSTGIGGPSAAVVLSELAELGVRRAIRLGTCVGVGFELGLGQLLAVEGAVAADGVSRALGVDAGDLATAPLLALGERLGVATASLLVVSELAGSDRGGPIGDAALAESAMRMGRAAATALDLN
jgi:uridine phosphorylase